METCFLVPIDQMFHIGITSMAITEFGAFMSDRCSYLLAALADDPDQLALARSPGGIGFDNGTPRTDAALSRFLAERIGAPSDQNRTARWRIELNECPPPKRDPLTASQQGWLRRVPSRWAAKLNVYLKFEGKPEQLIGTGLLSSAALEFLPPP
jgi:hypothetical protein